MAGKDLAVVNVRSGGSMLVAIDFTIISIARSAFGGMKMVAASSLRRTHACPVLRKSIATEKRHLLPLLAELKAFLESFAGSHGHGAVLPSTPPHLPLPQS